jgi:hypothetical protein
MRKNDTNYFTFSINEILFTLSLSGLVLERRFDSTFSRSEFHGKCALLRVEMREGHSFSYQYAQTHYVFTKDKQSPRTQR